MMLIAALMTMLAFIWFSLPVAISVCSLPIPFSIKFPITLAGRFIAMEIKARKNVGFMSISNYFGSLGMEQQSDRS